MRKPIPSLGGYIPVRNNNDLGYCVFEGIQSLLKICSEVVVADAESTDGTFEQLQRMADKDSRIKVVTFPWTNPKGVGAGYLIDWLNFAREHLTTKHQITLDADEILDDSDACLDEIEAACSDSNPARRFRRLNYWRDAYSLIPSGNCCSDSVARMGFQSFRMPTDQPTEPGEFAINDLAKGGSNLIIHHVGFIRPKDKFFAKSRVVQSIWINGYDKRLEDVEAAGKNQCEIEDCDWTNRLVTCDVAMPDAVQRLLSSWGHGTPNYLPKIIQQPDPVVQVERWDA